MPLSSATAFIAALRSAVEAVARAKGLSRARVDHRVNARGELVVALLVAGECDQRVHDEVCAGLQAMALKQGDGARVMTKRSARAGHVIAFVLPPRIAGQWEVASRPARPPDYRWSQQCLTCHAVVNAPDFLAILALGWRPESPHHAAPSSGWFCGKCASAPPSPPPKRYRR